jgi:hypothetical protein
MSSDPTAFLVAVLAFASVGLAFYLGWLRRWLPERRRADAWEWASRHLATYQEGWQ